VTVTPGQEQYAGNPVDEVRTGFSRNYVELVSYMASVPGPFPLILFAGFSNSCRYTAIAHNCKNASRRVFPRRVRPLIDNETTSSSQKGCDQWSASIASAQPAARFDNQHPAEIAASLLSSFSQAGLRVAEPRQSRFGTGGHGASVPAKNTYQPARTPSSA